MRPFAMHCPATRECHLALVVRATGTGKTSLVTPGIPLMAPTYLAQLVQPDAVVGHQACGQGRAAGAVPGNVPGSFSVKRDADFEESVGNTVQEQR